MMSRAIAALALVAATAATNAPADQYFGRLKMSTLRIRYETMQVRKRYEAHELYPDQAQHLLDLTADAFNGWSAAYPHDAWLPSTGFLLASLYGELPGGVARARAVRLLTYVTSHFPASRYAAESRRLLHRGLPLRRQPAWAIPTPAPSAPPASLASPSPGASSSAPSSPAPSPAATS